MSNEEPGTSIQSSNFSSGQTLKQLADLSAIAVPVGIIGAGVYELGFISTLGFSPPWQFVPLIPFPISELLRVGLLWAMATVIGFMVVVAILTISSAALVASQAIIDSVRKSGQLSSRICLATTGVLVRLLGSLIAVCAVPKTYDQWTMRIFMALLMWVTIVLCVWLFVLTPGLEYLLDYLFPYGDFGGRLISLIGYAVLWTIGVLIAVRGLGIRYSSAQISKTSEIYFRFLSPKRSLLALAMLGLVWSAGASESMDSLFDPQYPTRQIRLSNESGCKDLQKPILLRAYSNGLLMLEEKRIFWVPESGACWSLPLNLPEYEKCRYVPTVFGVPIHWLVIERFRSNAQPARDRPEKEACRPIAAVKLHV